MALAWLIPVSKWYHEIASDISKLPDFFAFYEAQIEEAKFETSVKGKTIERHEAELPGIVEQRFSQLQEIEAVLELMNIRYREKRSLTFRKYLEAYQKSLTSRDAEKYVDGDPDVVSVAMLVNEIALLRNKYLALHKGLEQKAWMMGHITRLKCAGLDDASVD